MNTEFTVIPDNDKLTVKIRCHEPQAEKIKHDFSGLGGKVWQDDLVEIFFGPVSNDRELSQFVVSAGGGRWMGRGRGSKVDSADYQFWSAKTALEKDGWTAEVTIAYRLTSWKLPPAKAKELSSGTGVRVRARLNGMTVPGAGRFSQPSS